MSWTFPPVQTPGPFAGVMGGLHTLLQTVNGELPDGTRSLTVDKWRRLHLPSLPALWNWVPTFSEAERNATAVEDDSFRVSTYVGVEHQDDQSQMEAIELYADVVAQVLDIDFRKSPLLGGTADIAERTGRRLVVDAFGGTDVLCVEFPLRLVVHQIVSPS